MRSEIEIENHSQFDTPGAIAGRGRGGGGRFTTLGIKRHILISTTLNLKGRFPDLQNFFENKKASFLLVTSLLGRFSC